MADFLLFNVFWFNFTSICESNLLNTVQLTKFLICRFTELLTFAYSDCPHYVNELHILASLVIFLQN